MVIAQASGKAEVLRLESSSGLEHFRALDFFEL